MDYAKILIVDDEPANVLLLERILENAGYSRIRTTTNSLLVEDLTQEFDPDIILLDLQMPGLDGFGVLAQLKRLVPVGTFVPVLVLTADVTSETKLRALSSGAHDFLTKPFDRAEVVQRVGILLHTRRLQLQVQAQKENLEELVHEQTKDLQEALHRLEGSQKQLIQQERLHAFGTMASGVTHDFNNALSVILGFGEIALWECETGPSTHELAHSLRMIVTAARDGAAMVTRLREFYRPGGTQEPRTAVDLNALLEQAVNITEPKWKTHGRANGVSIEVEKKFGDIPRIAAEPAELREALTNVIFNAVDAMTCGGTISIHTYSRDDDAVVEVSDTGTGMSQEVQSRCLEPFFTTKGERGTGMGLAMVYGIIERHGGTMGIRSTLGLGTTIIFTLPRLAGADGVIASHPMEPVRPLKIMVVDDQPILCEILAEYLKKDYHEVETYPDGQMALERFNSAAFDLVITDLVMPGISGEQLAAELKKVSPAARVILLTGFGHTPHGELYNGSADEILSKPISPIDLRHAIIRTLKVSAERTAA